MAGIIKSGLTKIGVFYDGNYFLHVSNYYVFQHSRSARLSIRGLHEFIRSEVARELSTDRRLCHVVDSHYFRGRISAYEARENNKLFSERQFDDILMNEGVATHYLPLKNRRGKHIEKGIDVWLALEAYELAMLKQYDVLVLIASDGDYVPLVRKLNSLGIKVMLLSWDFEFQDEYGEPRETRTSQDLMEEVSYTVQMHQRIEDRTAKNDPMVANLFVPQESARREEPYERHAPGADAASGEVLRAMVVDVKKGFGFIEYPPNNLFFHQSDLVDTDFAELSRFDVVEFTVGQNERGPCARHVRKVEDYDGYDSDADDEGYDDDGQEEGAYESEKAYNSSH